jgi:competence protein ComEA
VLSDNPRANLAIWVAAGLVAAFALFQLSGSKPGGGGGGGGSEVRIDRGPSAREAGSAGRRTAIYVHVAGAVRQPGLLRLPAGSRVARAVQEAGGPTRRGELSGVNLAAKVEDGQQIVVPVRGAVPVAGGAGGAGAAGGATPRAAAAPKPSLASATEEQLDEIDGIGPTLAQRIIEFRTDHGGFSSLGELRDVEGIGEKRFETLREALQP